MSDEEVIQKILKQLDNHEKRLSSLENIPIEKMVDKNKKITIKEFLLMKKPNDAVKSTLLIGYYLEHFESMDSFNIRDLTNGFRAAKISPPTNINDKANMNKDNEHMMPAAEKKDNKKAWVLTAAGEKYVEEGFKGEKTLK